MNCQHCHSENPSHFRFCGECGTSLVEQSEGQGFAASIPSSPPPHTPSVTLHTSSAEAERRHLTVMFCDLVSVSPLAGKLDPEELREIIRAYQEVCAAVVRRFEGYVARY